MLPTPQQTRSLQQALHLRSKLTVCCTCTPPPPAFVLRDSWVWAPSHRLPAPALSGIRGKIEMFRFSPGTMERAGLPSSAAMSIPPFVVIGSNDINQAALQDDPPTYWPERSYKWGTAEAFNPDHSDLLFLR